MNAVKALRHLLNAHGEAEVRRVLDALTAHPTERYRALWPSAPAPKAPEVIIKVEGILTQDLAKAIDQAIATYHRRHGRNWPR